MRLATYDKPRMIACGEDLPGHIGLPRACFEQMLGFFSELKIQPAIHDQRVVATPLLLQFSGTLRPEQETATAAMLAHDIGVHATTTAFGKTLIASNC
jgi:hypothetical protein